ncbi:MAG: hypothetical protein OEY41_16865 [Acidimicrobiia bacterium]|nr:hypothetical protein [Acidimicrobiia bacterium]MDH4364097.1 hypothetical protein [Acidimicrobiia bacterium]MDH5291668.1 hypothetical protein [Acidimicrobiia bacterium]
MGYEELVDVGASTLALGLVVVAFVQLLTGGAFKLGHAFRSTVEPVLASIRGSSRLSRAELADRTMLVAIALAAAGTVVQRSVAGVLMMVVLWKVRPLVRRTTREEHKLLAMAGTLSIDLVVGFYVPMTLAQLLLLQYLFAASMVAVMVALCWPAGGGSLRRRRWQLAPVKV